MQDKNKEGTSALSWTNQDVLSIKNPAHGVRTCLSAMISEA